MASPNHLHETEDTDEKFDLDLAQELYDNFRIAEMRNRPSTNFIETVQIDMNATMRAIVVDWLVEVTTLLELELESLFLAVDYLDRCLSRICIRRCRLLLLGTACVLVATKHEEEIDPPTVADFCYLTNNTYSIEEVLEMESEVLECLEFELTVPTVQSFLRPLIHMINSRPPMLECLANYVAELSLMEYRMLRYRPSLIAAASIFLAKFILRLSSTEHPWSAELRELSQYQPSELRECVIELHRLFCNTSKISTIRDKYSKSEYMSVSKLMCLPWIPSVYFQD